MAEDKVADATNAKTEIEADAEMELHEAELAVKRDVSKKNLEAAASLDKLKGGSSVLKVTHRHNTSDRFITFDKDELSISKVLPGEEGKKKKYTITKPEKEKQGSSLLCGLGSDPNLKQVHISQIDEIRDGALTDRFDKAHKRIQGDEEKCFSVIQKGIRRKTFDVVAPDKATKDDWVKGLRYLVKSRMGADVVTKQELYVREMFRKADKSGDQVLTLKEVTKLLKQLSMNVHSDDVKEEIKLADKDNLKTKKGEECLNLKEFVDFFHKFNHRKEVEELFDKYSYDDGNTLDIHELRDFFSKEQNQEYTDEEIKQLIQKYETGPDCKKENVMSLNGFNVMLLNGENMSILKPECQKVYMDMTQPLNHYYINSSHNTYLAADQLVGKSSVECYIRAIERGCRCVELDCWDGDDNEPVIYHGHTMTSKIKFKDAVEAIASAAFTTSDYPLILSLENHCSVEQQKVMAKYLTSILGRKLYTTPLPDDATQLPSPESLKGKYLIKGKKLPVVSECEEDNCVTDDDEDEDDDPEEMQAKKKKSAGARKKIAPELSNLVVILQGVHFNSFENTLQKYNFKQMSSIGESKAFKLAKESPMEFIRHNQFQITRNYPGGKRVDSSNYDPMPLWLVGCQLVALNYQTPDKPMQILTGRFEDNGKCGYILKPSFLTKADSTFNPNGPFPKEWKKTLKIKIISGFQLPKKTGDRSKSILDPYLILHVSGVPMDKKAVNTEVVHNNGFHPMWNAEFAFDVNVPEVAIVNFRVMDYESSLGSDLLDKDEAVAEYSLPFTCLHTGYRTVPLKTPKGEALWSSSLFVHIDIS